MSEMVPEFGGCLWPIDVGCLGDNWEVDYDESVRLRAQALATASLERLTAYRVGGCPVTVRPCSRACLAGFYTATSPDWISPGINLQGQWVNGCGCNTGCACEVTNSIALPPPVGRIDEVKIDGVALDPDEYFMTADSLLVRKAEPWPATQDMLADDTEENTFSITYLNAYPVDSLGAYACGQLTLEFAKSCANKACALPKGVTTVTRQGLTFSIVAGAFPEGLTGIRAVDAFVALWNPQARIMQSKVWTPNKSTVRRV